METTAKLTRLRIDPDGTGGGRIRARLQLTSTERDPPTCELRIDMVMKKLPEHPSQYWLQWLLRETRFLSEYSMESLRPGR